MHHAVPQEHDERHGKEGGQPEEAVVIGHIPLHPESPRSFLAEAVGTWAELQLAEATRPLGVPVVLGVLPLRTPAMPSFCTQKCPVSWFPPPCASAWQTQKIL